VSVPVLVGVQLLADLQAEVMHPLQRLTYLNGLRQAVQDLILDPGVKRLSDVLG
jgi:hypothetical protein